MDTCWSSLPKELLELIALCLMTDVTDYVRFGAVCKLWRSVFVAIKPPRKLPPQIPWLLINDENLGTCFFSPSLNRRISLKTPNPHTHDCIGSNHGWLIMIGKNSPSMFLLNPLTEAKIFLPPATEISWIVDYQPSRIDAEYAVKHPGGAVHDYMFIPSRQVTKSLKLRAELSSHPKLSSMEGGRCVVLLLSGLVHQFAFCTPGDKKWTTIVDNKETPNRSMITVCRDIRYHDGQFYVADRSSRVVVCDVGPPSPGTKQFATMNSYHQLYTEYARLVELSGELLFIIPRLRPFKYKYSEYPIGFRIFKLGQDSKEWVEVKNIGDATLFVGPYNSLSILASNYPGLKRNCIYFTDTSSDYICDIFDIENQCVEPLSFFSAGFEFSDPGNFVINERLPQVIWVTPSLW